LSGGQIQGAVLQASPIEPGKRDLVAGGTPEGDTIQFSLAGSGNVDVNINGVSQGTFAPSGRLVAYGMAGDDEIQVAGDLSRSAWLDGGPGDDRLNGGAGHDVLLGGVGDDQLHGGQGRDLMIGGFDADRLIGNADDDILIAGLTAFDNQADALAAIMAEWTSARSYEARIVNLRGDTTNPQFPNRLNGNFYLSADGPNATVFDDGAEDKLTGSSGRDWFFANLDSGVRDKLTDDHGNELVTDLD